MSAIPIAFIKTFIFHLAPSCFGIGINRISLKNNFMYIYMRKNIGKVYAV